MCRYHTHIRPHSHIFLHLPSNLLKLVEIKPNTIIDIGKFGTFPSNLLLGRPYHHTYELVRGSVAQTQIKLRIVPPHELNEEGSTNDSTPSNRRGDVPSPSVNDISDSYDLLAEAGTVILKNNRLTIDDASRQALSQQEIEELKKSSGGQEIIERILANHAGLEEKTAFSKAKYTLRKSRKYLKRFTALPMDLRYLMEYVLQKEPSRIIELREETLGLIMAWSNAHVSFSNAVFGRSEGRPAAHGRWLVCEDTGGLIVAALAERMDTLRSGVVETNEQDRKQRCLATQPFGSSKLATAVDVYLDTIEQPATTSKAKEHRDFPLPETSNSITLLHPAIQPNLSILKYFGYDTNQPGSSHPLQTHLKSLSWLQFLHPDQDATYQEPVKVPDEVLQSWKSGKRGTYWKKRRRWERCRAIVDEARAGGFDGLVIASEMDPASILAHAVPLIRGGGHVAVYSPTIEPLIAVMDLYSKERRTAYMQQLAKNEVPDSVDFPVDPRLLLGAMLQTSRVREWQVLPGRTHPLMTGRGGAEGYVFTARKVVPLEGGVEARGNFSNKRRKTNIPHLQEPNGHKEGESG